MFRPRKMFGHNRPRHNSIIKEFSSYLRRRPRIWAQLCFEVDRPSGSSQRIWSYFDYWPHEWKRRLADFFKAYRRNEPLPLSDVLPLADFNSTSTSTLLAYRDVNLARDVYLAQVAHALYLDCYRKVPWRLEDWSDNELSYLLSSKVCFRARRIGPEQELYYTVRMSSRGDRTENILHDPRVAYGFMDMEPEEGKHLIGRTPSETCLNLTEWFHDYLWHNPPEMVPHDYYNNHPTLEERLQRHNIEPHGEQYFTPWGCGSASCLFADLTRSVSIPVRKVWNVLLSESGREGNHSGLIFDWHGSGGPGRYLLHTDDIYCSYYFQDPAPSPKNMPRGVALWDEVWLSPSRFGRAFSHMDNAHEKSVFARATWEQRIKYETMGSWLISAAKRVQKRRKTTASVEINRLIQLADLTETEAEACLQAVHASVLAYGNGNMRSGYQQLLDGPESRHEQWCKRTGKCNPSVGLPYRQ